MAERTFGRVGTVLGGATALALCLACAGLEQLIPPPEVTQPEPVAAPEPAPPRFFYVPGAKGVEDASFSAWEAGDRVFVGADATNLRSEASIKGEVLEQLDLGMEVEVLEAATEPMVLIGRLNVWYRVRTRLGTEGFLFGAVLTPLRIALYRDGVAEPRVAVVSFSPEFGPRVRLWDAPTGPVYALDARPSETFTEGGTLSAKAVGDAVEVTLCDLTTNKCNAATMALRGEELVQISPPVD